MDSYFTRVYQIVGRIPYGKVASYGQIARMTGNPRAARQVGWAMRCCPEELPWHRVVKADGTITGGMHPELPRAMLKSEGVLLLEDGRVDMLSCSWNGEA